ncbi:MAG: ribose-phosphate diphosphokinase [archaeon]
MLIAGCPGAIELAKRIARKVKSHYSNVEIGTFPDGETNLRFTRPVKGQHVILVQTMRPANENMMEAMFAAYTARDLGAKKVTLIAPYLAYMREDKRFHSGECISARVMARLLSAAFDRIITIDPHLHRFHKLSEIFSIPAARVTAAGIIGQYVKRNIRGAVIIGPDEESDQWAEEVAKVAKVPADVLTKTRYSSVHVEIHFRSGESYKRKHAVLVDDIISTGHTMMETIKQLKRMGVKRITCIGVHGLFTDDAYPKMKKMGVKIVTANTISHPTNGIDVSGLLKDALGRWS